MVRLAAKVKLRQKADRRFISILKKRKEGLSNIFLIFGYYWMRADD